MLLLLHKETFFFFTISLCASLWSSKSVVSRSLRHASVMILAMAHIFFSLDCSRIFQAQEHIYGCGRSYFWFPACNQHGIRCRSLHFFGQFFFWGIDISSFCSPKHSAGQCCIGGKTFEAHTNRQTPHWHRWPDHRSKPCAWLVAQDEPGCQEFKEKSNQGQATTHQKGCTPEPCWPWTNRSAQTHFLRPCGWFPALSDVCSKSATKCAHSC